MICGGVVVTALGECDCVPVACVCVCGCVCVCVCVVLNFDAEATGHILCSHVVWLLEVVVVISGRRY
jgi:hypothetical protein